MLRSPAALAVTLPCDIARFLAENEFVDAAGTWALVAGRQAPVCCCSTNILLLFVRIFVWGEWDEMNADLTNCRPVATVARKVPMLLRQ
jgi:hypothetical protein